MILLSARRFGHRKVKGKSLVDIYFFREKVWEKMVDVVVGIMSRMQAVNPRVKGDGNCAEDRGSGRSPAAEVVNHSRYVHVDSVHETSLDC